MEENTTGHGEITKVTDYLYEVTYTGYEGSYADAQAYMEKYQPALGGCSSVQNGTIRGRNYDWTLDEAPEFVIHVPAAEGRHASVGVATTTSITAADVDAGEELDMYAILPYFTLDGINDAGVTINVNVVNYGEMGAYTMKTEDTSDDVCPLMVSRIVLDRAGTVEEALALISGMDIYSLGTQDECHFMLSGPASAEDDTLKTVVVEFIPDEDQHYQMNVIENFVDDKAIMTNFHLTGFDGTVESLTAHPMGYERYLILANAYDQGSTVNGMKDLMKKVYYTKAYDAYGDGFWYSDFAKGDLTMANTGEAALNGDYSRAGAYEETVRKAIETYLAGTRTSEEKAWHTVHTSVYDMENRTLSVLPQESGFSYDFDLTGRISAEVMAETQEMKEAAEEVAEAAVDVAEAVMEAIETSAAAEPAEDAATEATGAAEPAEATADATEAAETVTTDTAEPVEAAADTTDITEAAVTAAEESTAPGYKVLCDRVIEVTYDTFDFDAGAQYLSKYDTTMGGCSAVRVLVDGKVYVGRDYDFYCSDAPAFVVRNNAGKIRTIGIGNSPTGMDAWSDDFTLRGEVLTALPYLCCDVMSEAGLYCETNTRPYEEALSCTSTNPGAPRRCTQTFMQTMLSQYATIDEVLEHLNDYDWYDLSKMGFEQSFFLTDQSGRSVVIEFGANQVVWQEAEYNANYFLNNDLYAIETIGCGEMRLARELAYKPYVRTEEDIFTMMEQGAYDQFYHTDVDADFAVPELYKLIGYDKNTAAADPEGAQAAAKARVEEVSTYTWEQRVSEKTWESTFITAANVTDLCLHVHFSEHYNIDFTVTFD